MGGVIAALVACWLFRTAFKLVPQTDQLDVSPGLGPLRRSGCDWSSWADPRGEVPRGDPALPGRNDCGGSGTTAVAACAITATLGTQRNRYP